MKLFDRLFKRSPSPSEQAEVARDFRAMTEAMARETPEQKRRFYLEVAAGLGNESAAKRVAEVGSDPERSQPN